MATYGPFLPVGFIPFSGFTPTLGVTDAIVPQTSGVVQMNGMTQGDNQIARSLYQGPNRLLRRLMLTLLGAATGASAVENRSRVAATQATFTVNDNGGLIPIETVAVINRVTTALDLTNTLAVISRSFTPTYAVDASGNGGGSHLGY